MPDVGRRRQLFPASHGDPDYRVKPSETQSPPRPRAPVPGTCRKSSRAEEGVLKCLWYNCRRDLGHAMGKPSSAISFLIALLVLGAMVLATPPSPTEATGPLVLAFYYAWYDMSTWGSGQLPDLPAQQYVSADAATIGRHVSQAQSAGIDGFVQSWYGPAGGNQTEGNFQMLLNTAAASGFRAAVDFEVGSPYFTGPQDRIAALEHLLTVHANHPAYLRVDSRPVVFFWASWLLSVAQWSDIRDQVDPGHNSIWLAEGASTDYLSVFDGLHLYNIAWSDDPAGTLAYWGDQVRSRAAALGGHRYWAATVMPGWDDTRLPGKGDAFVRDRAGGAYYQQCWAGAVTSGPDMVIITSFNEWLEGSMIEPSVSYGDFYLNLTAQLAAAYRAGSIPVPPLQPAEGPSPTPEPDASPRPSATAGPSATPLNTATPLATPTALPDGSIVHVVASGDTLLGIADRYGVTLEVLLALNHLEPDDLLSVGRSIVVQILTPTSTPRPPTRAATPSVAPTVVGAEEGGASSGQELRPEGPAGEATQAVPEVEAVIVNPPTVTRSPTDQPPTAPVPGSAEEPSMSSPGLPCLGSLLVGLGGCILAVRARRNR
jgi:LysM repeat protein